MVSIRPHLWYHENALEAAEFYASLLPDSRIDKVHAAPPGAGPEGTFPIPEGAPFFVEFTLVGMPVAAIAAGPDLTLTDAFSFLLEVDTQEEVDHYWAALTADGGSEGPCGWCRDRFGLSWQVVPRGVNELTMGADAASTRAREAMFAMTKLDLPALQAAYDGEPAPA